MPSLPHVALLCGNGLSISRRVHVGLDLDPSSLFSWPVPDPEGSGRLLDRLTHLNGLLSGLAGTAGTSLTNVAARLVRHSAMGAPFPESESDALALWELRHFLCVAFSWYQFNLDRLAPREDRWPWLAWIKRSRRDLSLAISFNYDLVLERLLEAQQVRYCYPGGLVCGAKGDRIGAIAPWQPRARRDRPAVVIYKPHGSINFESKVDIVFDSEGKSSVIGGLHIPWLISMGDHLIKIVPSGNMFSIRTWPSVVAPGEWSRPIDAVPAGGAGGWRQQGVETIDRLASSITELLVVGFAYSECDRPETDYLLDRLPFLQQATIVDPNPSAALVESLQDRGVMVRRANPPSSA